GARPIAALRAGAPCTWFLASATPQAARKTWIAGMKPMGALLVDDGAAAALRRGKSLLPAGLRAVEGGFERGDPVEVRTLSGVGVGQALSSYAAEEARRIAGLQSGEIAGVLGYPGRAVVAHHNDLALWG
ncbi:MAG: PUA domain-containing protein, partial [Pseudomonadota bacterium]